MSRFDELHAMPITEDWQVEIMRRIYNDCLPDLATKPLAEVGEQEQQDWWKAKDKMRTKAFLYIHQTNIVAFSLLQQKGHFWTPLFGIHRFHRGKGFARKIIQHYISEAEGPLAGEALVENRIINKLNLEAGWKQVGSRGDDVLLLYHQGRDPSQDAYDEILRYHGVA